MAKSVKRDAILNEIDSEWVARGTIRPLALMRWLNMAIDAAKEEVRAEIPPQRPASRCHPDCNDPLCAKMGCIYGSRPPGPIAGFVPYGSVPYTCSCTEVIAYKGSPDGYDICLACGGAFRMHDVSRRPAGPVTCQCREPEAYCNSELKAIVCNLCGYPLSPDRDKLPPRADTRDFGPELDLSMGEPGTLGDIARAMVEGAASHAIDDGCPGIAAALRYLATARHSTLTIHVSPSYDGSGSFHHVAMSFNRSSPENQVSRNGE